MEKLRRTEISLFECVGVPAADLTIRDVPIWQDKVSAEEADEYYIHEIRVKPLKADLPKLVLVHGYAGGGAVFYKMLVHLRQFFECITIDLLG